jgi:hypothetical protein
MSDRQGIPRWSLVERVIAPLTRSYARKKRILLPLTFLALVLSVFLGSLEQLLRDLHEYGGERSGTPALANELFAGPDPDHTARVVTRWRDAAEVAGAELDWILGPYVIVDTVFVLVYATLLGMLLVMLKEKLGRPEPPATGADLTPYRRPVVIALGALAGLALADIAENAAIAAVASESLSGFFYDAFVWALWLAFRAKLLFGLLLLATGGLAAITFLVQRSDIRKPAFAALSVVRGQLIVVAALFAGLFFLDQAVDALRRWYEEPEDAIFAILMLGWLSFLMLVSARELLAKSAARRTGTESPGTLMALGVVLLGAALVSGLVFEAWIGLATLGALLVVLGILSRLVDGIPATGAGRDVGAAAGWVPLTLALVVLVLPVLALVRAIAAPVVLGDPRLLWLLVPIGAFVALTVVLVVWHERLGLFWQRRKPRRAFVWGTLALIALVFLRLIHNPWRTSEAFGAIAFLGAFLIVLAFVLHFLVRRAEELRPPDIVTLLRFRCTPVILIAVVWVLATAYVDRETSYHDARTIAATPAALRVHDGVTPQDALARWQAREAATGEAQPLLFVAAAGGGIRAAYWTATVLSCVLEGKGEPAVCREGGERANERGTPSLFAASGISGGSLGLASYFAHLTDDVSQGWQRERLDDDYAAALFAWMLFVDFPSTLVRRTGGDDRAAILEQAIERSWVDNLADQPLWRVWWGGAPSVEGSRMADGLLESWEAQSPRRPLPILMLNGAKVQDGCRLNVSVLDAAIEPVVAEDETFTEDCLSLRLFEAGEDEAADAAARRPEWALATTDDLLTYLCRDQREMQGDVRLSTAVMLSARFPYALPSGRLTRCRGNNPSPANVVDGGYFDTSGASPLVELWGSLAPIVSDANLAHLRPESAGAPPACIVPYFLQIDTGYADPVKRSDQSPSELLVPLLTARRARDAREHNARQAAALLFSGAPETGLDVPVRYAHVYPHAHPGARAPLGWTLSLTAREELEEQLVRNAAEIRKVRRWLASQRECPTTP